MKHGVLEEHDLIGAFNLGKCDGYTIVGKHDGGAVLIKGQLDLQTPMMVENLSDGFLLSKPPTLQKCREGGEEVSVSRQYRVEVGDLAIPGSVLRCAYCPELKLWVVKEVTEATDEKERDNG